MTVAQLLASMTSAEFTEWMAHDELTAIERKQRG